MVKPEFKPFSFMVEGADRFHVISNGKSLLDFSGSAMTTGYNFIKTEWLEPVVSRLVFDNPYTEELTRRLLAASGFQNAAFSTSGTEACDTALTRYGKPFSALEGAYHGLTFLTATVSNGTGYDRSNNVIHLKCPSSSLSLDDAISYDRDLLNSIPDDVRNGTLIFELIQSDGGVNILPEEFVKYLFKVAADLELKTIVDEVYTGFGRSGELFLFKKYGIEPDMVCLGKGMAAGLPIGSVLYNGNWNLPYNQVVSMQAANMFVSRVGVEVLRSMDEKRLDFVRKQGMEMVKTLSEIDNSRIYEVRGRGFMIGVELVDGNNQPDGKYAFIVREKLADKGVICSLTGENNNVLKITPPVLIDEETLWQGIDKIVSTLNDKN